METEKRSISQEVLKETIVSIMGKINSCNNPEELEEIKKTIKQNVPFTRRGYFSAMLLKELLESSSPRKERKEAFKEKEKEKENYNNRENIKEEETKEKEGSEKKERVLPPDAKTLYLNIGKMKHLYAKNLSILLQKELGIKREDIYSLRVHDKYSFITMSEENCQKAIDKLNGKEINGRVAQINFSIK